MACLADDTNQYHCNNLMIYRARLVTGHRVPRLVVAVPKVATAKNRRHSCGVLCWKVTWLPQKQTLNVALRRAAEPKHPYSSKEGYISKLYIFQWYSSNFPFSVCMTGKAISSSVRSLSHGAEGSLGEEERKIPIKRSRSTPDEGISNLLAPHRPTDLSRHSRLSPRRRRSAARSGGQPWLRNRRMTWWTRRTPAPSTRTISPSLKPTCVPRPPFGSLWSRGSRVLWWFGLGGGAS